MAITRNPSDTTLLLFRNTMRVMDGHLLAFREAIARAVDFAQLNGPQLMVQTFLDGERLLAHSFQLYADSDAVRRHWELADPYIRDVMEHCVVETFEVFGTPDEDIAAALRSSTTISGALAFSPRIAGFDRFGLESASRTDT